MNLRSLMREPDGWGRQAGRVFQAPLIGKVGKEASPELLRLSLGGIKRLDVTFAETAIIAVVRHHLTRHGICLTDPANDEVVDNIAAAAERGKVPVLLWRGAQGQVLGPQPQPALEAALGQVMDKGVLRANELARTLQVSLPNASTRLKQLWQAGYVLRDEVPAASGGAEFVYSRIG